ncbi:MAG: hypothetical protein HYZ53_16170 [Planctomycetes bacterium]|nr:hypothetical protein [Planctomycetota bacterium]
MSFRFRSLVPVLALTTALAAALPTHADEAVQLAWKFKAGSKRSYLSEGTTDQSVVGVPMKMGFALNQEQSEEVTAAAGGSGTITSNVEHVAIKANLGPAGKVDFDSNRPEDKDGGAKSPIVAQLITFLKNPIKYESDASGKVGSVSMAAGKMPPGVDEATLRKHVESDHLSFPRKGCTKGESWNAEADLPLPQLGTATRTRTYTFEGVEAKGARKVARISFVDAYRPKEEKKAAGEDLVDPDGKEDAGTKGGKEDEGEDEPGMKMAGLKGSGKGEYLFLVDEGYLLEQHEESKISFEISMGQMKVVQETTQKSTRKLKE